MTIAHIIITALRAPELEDSLVDLGVRVATRIRAALPQVAAPAAHMTRTEYARSRRISGATVSRLIAQGMPALRVGTTDRIDPVAADEWRRTTPAAATTPAKKNSDVDVSGSLARAGLKAGGR